MNRAKKVAPVTEARIDPAKHQYQLFKEDKHGDGLFLEGMFTNEEIAVDTGILRGATKCIVIGPRGTFRVTDYLVDRRGNSGRLMIRGVVMPDGSRVMDPPKPVEDWERDITNLRSGVYAGRG